jgi:hypothetical protein
MRRLIVALNKSRTITGVLHEARYVAERLGSDPALYPAYPPLDVFWEHIDALAASIVRARSRLAGSSSAQIAALAIVAQDLVAVQSHVQQLADANPAEAGSIIERAGMFVKRTAGPTKFPFTAERGPGPGTARLRARAEKTRASYEWEWSLDGVTWNRADSTVRADTLLVGLPEATRVYFRYRAVTKEGVGKWSDVLSLILA